MESMEVLVNTIILQECGYDQALLGLSLSYGADLDRMPEVAHRLSSKDGGHKITKS